MTFLVSSSRAALATTACEMITQKLSDALQSKGRASLMCSGGSTPGPVYQNLSEKQLDWEKVTVGLADERWVEPNSEFSNERLLRETLLQANARTARFLPMKTDAITAVEAVADVDMAYQSFSLPIDVMVLGMGNDGHSLSWFPGAAGLDQAIDLANESMVAAIKAAPSNVTGVHTERMTLTRKAVENTSLVLLLMTGEEKRKVYEDGDSQLPIRTVQDAAQSRLTVLWAE